MLIFTDYLKDIAEKLGKLFPDFDKKDLALDRTGHADFTFRIFRVLKGKRNPEDVFAQVLKDFQGMDYIERITLEGPYINFRLNAESLAFSIRNELEHKGMFPDIFQDPERISVEHTSTNPTGPIHIGRIRNSILGDSTARILRRYGYRVTTQYFVNDSGRQVASLCTGARKYCMEDSLTTENLLDAYRRIHREMEENDSLEKEVQEVMQLYEAGEENTVGYIRKICSVILDSINSSLRNIGITIDDYTWESSFIRTGDTVKVLDSLAEHIKEEGGAKYITNGDRKIFLTRSNGTSLYFLRDIAYHLYKFQNFTWSIDVLGENHKDHGEQLSYVFEDLMDIHERIRFMYYSYVSLESGSMSTRKGNTVTLDELLQKTIEEAEKVVRTKRPDLDEGSVKNISESVAVSAIRFSIVRLNASKQMIFRWGEALNFEGDSAPYIMYAYARASSILRKTGSDSNNPEYVNVDAAERDLLFRLYCYPYFLEEAANKLKPEIVAGYLLDLTKSYSEFYRACPVLTADEVTKRRRIEILKFYRKIVEDSTDLLGIKILEEM